NPDVVLSGTTTQQAGAWNDFYVLAQTYDAELYLDDIAYSDEGWIGPEATLVDTSASDAATTTDTSLVDRTILVAAADTGTLQEAADASTAGLVIPATDQAATYETAAITAAAGTADIAALTQHAAVTAAPSSDDTPAAVLAETTGVTAVAAGGDTGSLDEASALEQRHTGTDQATLSETTDLEQTTGPVVVDLAAFADLEAVGAALTAADAALVDDLVSLAEYRTDADQATLADISALAVVTGDIGLVGEHAVSAATFDRVDTAVLLEALHVLQPTAAADAAVFTDHAIVRMVGSPTGVGHPYTDWTASTPYT
ncbi:MAG TPA: hypothetical protein VK028_06665, partial [Micromonosporaceae bacterium]|nr:hypothetical protein [Micromonosporaceae bacterium]